MGLGSGEKETMLFLWVSVDGRVTGGGTFLRSTPTSDHSEMAGTVPGGLAVESPSFRWRSVGSQLVLAAIARMANISSQAARRAGSKTAHAWYKLASEESEEMEGGHAGIWPDKA